MFRVCIIKNIYGHEIKLAKYPGHNELICSVHDYQYKDIMSYNDIINNISNQYYEDIVWKFKGIDYQGLLNYFHSHYKVSSYNVLIKW